MAVSHGTPVVVPHLKVGHTEKVIGIGTTASTGFFGKVDAGLPIPPRQPSCIWNDR
jgi:hypothetical protein